jgi:hypothetical protein
VVSDGILDQFGIVSSAQHVHDPVLVIGNRSCRHLQDAADSSDYCANHGLRLSGS